MLAKVYSCAIVGLDGAIVEVEVDTANGLPSFVDIVPGNRFRGRVHGKAGEDW
jgi:magnesium chelatase family protein